MSGPNGERCEDCYFAILYGDEIVCLRNPPQKNEDGMWATFPVLHQGDFWCGEFKRLEATDEANVEK